MNLHIVVIVQEGDLLFTIDRRQYLALVEAREAELARARAEVAMDLKKIGREGDDDEWRRFQTS